MLGILKGLALAPAHRETGPPDWLTVRDDMLKHPLLRIPRLRTVFLAALTRAHYFPELRDDTRFYATMVLPALHRALLEFGRRLVEAGILERPEDVFYLKVEELERIHWKGPPESALANELRTRVQTRKTRRAALEEMPLVDPRLIRGAEPRAARRQRRSDVARSHRRA